MRDREPSARLVAPLAPLVAAMLAGCPAPMQVADGGDAMPASDARADVHTDAPADVAVDAPADVAVDAPADVAIDAPSDVAPDAATDASVDVATNPCDGGQRFCGGLCVDVSSDPANCGACGTSCPGPPNVCQHPVCATGVCGTEYTPDGTPVTAQVSGDCQRVVCNGAGGLVSRADATDLPAPGPNACAGVACTAGVPSFPPLAAGAACTRAGGAAGVCDGRATPACVACIADAQCGGATPACDTATNTCVACTADTYCPTRGQPRCDTATHACVPDTVLLFAANLNTGGATLAASFHGAVWSASLVPAPAAGIYAYHGGGVVVTANGRGVAAASGSSDGELYELTYRGAWATSFTRVGTILLWAVSRPAVAPSGAVLAQTAYMPPTTGPVDFAAFDDATSTWAPTAQATGASGDSRGIPAVVSDASGNPIVLAAADAPSRYVWTRLGASAWSAPLDVAGSAYLTGAMLPQVDAVRRAGSSQLVAVMRTGPGATTLSYSVWDGTTWSAAADVATDSNQYRAFSLAALGDGRVALAYVDGSDHVRYGFYDGAAWGAFSTFVPSPGLFPVNAPIAIARGANGEAVLELAWAADMGVYHARLVTGSPAMWTASTAVSTAYQYGGVWLSVGP